MKLVKCDALFCKYNQKAGICSHPNAQPGIMNENMKPIEFCGNYRKFSQKAWKLKKK